MSAACCWNSFQSLNAAFEETGRKEDSGTAAAAAAVEEEEALFLMGFDKKIPGAISTSAVKSSIFLGGCFGWLWGVKRRKK